MTSEEILRTLQEAIDARDPERLIGLWDDSALLIGTSGDGRDRAGLLRYLTALATQPESLRWEWSETVPFHEGDGELGFAAFGEIVVTKGQEERRAPIRVTIFAVETPDGWRLRQFHGSVPTQW
ncbi:MAG TPA: nuclear transport factor 2 family protein [Gaiellaceae bacterium]|nr:nuclear transport factor 2 family protein [Gaiellaceae bacterium]